MSENHCLSEESAKFAGPQLYHEFTDLAYVLGPVQGCREDTFLVTKHCSCMRSTVLLELPFTRDLISSGM